MPSNVPLLLALRDLRADAGRRVECRPAPRRRRARARPACPAAPARARSRPARICSEIGVGPMGRNAKRADELPHLPLLGEDLQATSVRRPASCRRWSGRARRARASASSRSVGHACGGPKECTRIDAPSRMSATASSAVSQIRFVAIGDPECHGEPDRRNRRTRSAKAPPACYGRRVGSDGAAGDIRTLYVDRLAARRRDVERLARRDDGIARTRVVTFVVAGVLVWQVAQGSLAGWWLLVPAAVFVALVVGHRRTRDALDLTRRSVDFYERGLARIDERWSGTGVTGDRFRDPAPSVRRRPRPLRARLALRAPLHGADAAGRGAARAHGSPRPRSRSRSARGRRRSVELGRAIDLREDLARPRRRPAFGARSRGARRVGDGPAAARLARAPRDAACSASSPRGRSSRGRLGAGPAWFVLAIVARAAGRIAMGYATQRAARVAAVDEPARELALWPRPSSSASERSSFDAPRCVALVQALGGRAPRPRSARSRRLRASRRPGRRPSKPALRAARARAALAARRLAFAIEAWRRRHGPARRRAGSPRVGEIEALVRPRQPTPASIPAIRFPELVERGRRSSTARRSATRSCRPRGASATTSASAATLRVLVVSGSNMSGKSTLLRTVGINAVLALAGAPVRATRLRLAPLAIGASIRIAGLAAGRHVALLRRDHAAPAARRPGRGPAPAPLPARRDPARHELARPRASAPRRSSAASSRRGAVGLVTTHDLALAEHRRRTRRSHARATSTSRTTSRTAGCASTTGCGPASSRTQQRARAHAGRRARGLGPLRLDARPGRVVGHHLRQEFPVGVAAAVAVAEPGTFAGFGICGGTADRFWGVV